MIINSEQPGAAPEPMASLPSTPHDPGSPNKKSLKTKKRLHIWPQQWSTKKKRIATGILAAVIVLLLSVGGWLLWRHYHKAPKEQPAAQKTETPPPTTEKSNLTGVEVPIGTNKRTVIGVMVENSPDARPQAGLNQAGVVYEAIAEGGITRFLALYQDNQPDYVGPVRSARPYFVEWVAPFNAGYAHVGGSPEALALIKSLGVKDLDQFSNPGAYQRINSRYAPHNVYTSIPALENLVNEKGLAGSNYTSFPRKSASAPVNPPTAKTINFAISSALYNVQYTYDPASNSYLRNQGGAPHVDDRTKNQLAPNVVIALVMPYSIASDRVHSVYGTTGSGQMFVFQDGGVVQGTWSKPDAKSQFSFTGPDGKPLDLIPGQTWITAVKDAGSVTYTP